MAVAFPAVGSIADGTRIHAPLLVDRCMESGNGIAGKKAGGIALSADSLIVSAVKRSGLFYMLKLRTLFFRIIKILHVL